MSESRAAAFAYSKMRREVGLVGVEVVKQQVKVKLAHAWPINEIERLIDEAADMREQFKWASTFIEQETGEYLIKRLKAHMPMRVITTKKKVAEVGKVRRIKVMDKIEMTEYLHKLLVNGQIRFPKHASHRMQALETQIEMLAKHVTEAGSVDYYTPGEEPDHFVRALTVVCFGRRRSLAGVTTPATIMNIYPATHNEFNDFDVSPAQALYP